MRRRTWETWAQPHRRRLTKSRAARAAPGGDRIEIVSEAATHVLEAATLYVGGCNAIPRAGGCHPYVLTSIACCCEIVRWYLPSASSASCDLSCSSRVLISSISRSIASGVSACNPYAWVHGCMGAWMHWPMDAQRRDARTLRWISTDRLLHKDVHIVGKHPHSLCPVAPTAALGCSLY